MWTGLWGDRPEEDVPIGHITNGIHVPSWLAPQMQQFVRPAPALGGLAGRHVPGDFGRYRERQRRGALGDPRRAQDPPARLRPAASPARGGAPRGAGRRPGAVVARAQPGRPDHRIRAPRGHLQARRPCSSRTRSGSRVLVNDPQRPIQFVIAGKAHPRDEPAKGVLQPDSRAEPGRPLPRASSSSSRTTTSASDASSSRGSTSG